MSDRVSKELSASAKSLSKSRECFIEVYIDNRCLIVIIYKVGSCGLYYKHIIIVNDDHK